MGNNIYLKFDTPKSNEDIPEDGIIKKFLIKIIVTILSFILPKGNPDFDELIHDVDIWKIEYDVDEDYVSREIGFDKNGNAILAMPLNNNYGFWTDISNMKLDDFYEFNPVAISETEFNTDWNNFTSKFYLKIK